MWVAAGPIVQAELYGIMSKTDGKLKNSIRSLTSSFFNCNVFNKKRGWKVLLLASEKPELLKKLDSTESVGSYIKWLEENRESCNAWLEERGFKTLNPLLFGEKTVSGKITRPVRVIDLGSHRHRLQSKTTSHEAVAEVKQSLYNPPEKVDWQLQVSGKFIQLSQSAKKRDKEFTLTLKDVDKLLKQKTCYYTDAEFGTGDYKRTIDRVDPEKGYVEDNVVACTHWANQFKNDLFEKPSRDYDKNIEMIYKIVDKVREFEKCLKAQ